MIDNTRLAERLRAHRRRPIPGMKTMLIICGGAMRGVYGAGATLALQQLGIRNFDIVVGNSTGAPTGAYFLAGPASTQQGASIYYQDCPRVFIQPRQLRQPLNFSSLMAIMRSGQKTLDLASVQASTSEFFVIATNVRTGQGEFINAKTARPDIFAAINASIAIPTFSAPVRVNGQEYIDGDIEPLPAAELIRRWRPTDVLIIPNRLESSLTHWHSRLSDIGFGAATLHHRHSEMTRQALHRTKKIAEGISIFAEAKNVTAGILWPPLGHRIHMFTTDSRRLRSACRAAGEEVLKYFGESNLRLKLE